MPLVAYDEQRLFLNLPPGTDEGLIGDLLDAVMRNFERACKRPSAPFSKAIAGRVDTLEARPGSVELRLEYPVKAVTAIALGRNVALPDETLDPADPAKVYWQVGSRILTRVDGGLWEANSPLLSWTRGGAWPAPDSLINRSSPSWVKVTYDTVDDLPKDAKLAVMRVTANIYRQRGNEHLKSWSLGDESQVLAAAQDDPMWTMAVENHIRHAYR